MTFIEKYRRDAARRRNIEFLLIPKICLWASVIDILCLGWAIMQGGDADTWERTALVCGFGFFLGKTIADFFMREANAARLFADCACMTVCQVLYTADVFMDMKSPVIIISGIVTGFGFFLALRKLNDWRIPPFHPELLISTAIHEAGHVMTIAAVYGEGAEASFLVRKPEYPEDGLVAKTRYAFPDADDTDSITREMLVLLAGTLAEEIAAGRVIPESGASDEQTWKGLAARMLALNHAAISSENICRLKIAQTEILRGFIEANTPVLLKLGDILLENGEINAEQAFSICRNMKRKDLLSGLVENPAGSFRYDNRMENIVDGIYDDGCGIYFNYNVDIPDCAPDDIKELMGRLGDALKAGRVQEFLGGMELVEMLVKSAHAAHAISAMEASRIMSVLGWEYHGTD